MLIHWCRRECEPTPSCWRAVVHIPASEMQKNSLEEAHQDLDGALSPGGVGIHSHNHRSVILKLVVFGLVMAKDIVEAVTTTTFTSKRDMRKGLFGIVEDTVVECYRRILANGLRRCRQCHLL